MCRKFLTLCLLTIGLMITPLHPLAVRAEDEPPVALPPHCRGYGPLTPDPDYCGCTWGILYYRGQPVQGANVTLHFQDKRLTTRTQPTLNSALPYYDLTGKGLGAQRSDILTLTVNFAGAELVRPFRAAPASEGATKGEQEVPLVLPERGEWTPLLTGGYTHTLTIQGQTLWAGGPAGLIALDLTTRQVTTQTLPWPAPVVRAFAIGPNNALWVAGPHHLATWSGQQWQSIPAPFAATIRAIAVHPQSGHLWVGGGDSNGALARYDGQNWQTVTAIAEPITALALAPNGGLWVGAWEGGVYQRADTAGDLNSGWQRYHTQEGLASDFVGTIAVSAQHVWIGGEPYLDTNGYHGGISRYDLSAGSWRTYTMTHGLPADADLGAAPVAINALAVAGDGLVWAGLPSSVHFQATSALWLTDTVAAAPISAVAAAGERVVAAQQNGALLYLDRRVTPGQPPVAQLTPPPTQRLTLSDTLHLTATAGDQDEPIAGAAAQVLAWDWRSTIDGPICTTAGECTIAANSLTAGEHTISLRVQDDEGVWSVPVTTTVTIHGALPVAPQQLYLPLVRSRP
ncbi:MAG: hypothetical protein DYG89_26395 [Caldilinea sp. CFX5]|nr:hypothetical protein [Caldilinea sp. CFX5]